MSVKIGSFLFENEIYESFIKKDAAFIKVDLISSSAGMYSNEDFPSFR